MKLIINNSSMQPIYEQIVIQIKEKIMSGEAKSEQMLPSVRSLAKDLRISALTVKKAYDALEKEGFIVTVQGKGSFIQIMNNNLILEEQRKDVENSIENAIQKGRRSGMSKDEIRDIFNLLMED